MTSNRNKPAICVFCGSKSGLNPLFTEAAQQLGQQIAERGYSLVYGGANIGLMKTVADAALAAGGDVIGVMPKHLEAHEISHQHLTQLHIVDDMHSRKAKMAALSDASITLPGGIGTLEELFEIWTWSQLAIHNKPLSLLNVDHYYDPLLEFIDQSVQQAFVKPDIKQRLIVQTDSNLLLDALESAMKSAVTG